MIRFAPLASAALFAGALALPALAQEDAPSAVDCPGMGQMMGKDAMQDGMMGQGMMQGGMMQGMGGQMMGGGMMGGGPGRFVEGRIAFVEAELAPTEEQRPRFDAWADALRSQAQSMQAMHDEMMAGDRPSSYPERLEHMERAMSARLDSLAALREAVTPLYESLDDRQRQVFDQLMGMM